MDGVAANARVADTLIIALPIELTREQRHAAIAGFMEKIGHGRIAWLAAFHDLGNDEHNPHCHLIFRDADIETGRKVVGTTTSAKDVRQAQEHGWRVPPRMTTKDLRVAWCEHLNAEMARHGLDARFDQRRLKDQGVDRQPGIHVGPKAMSMAAKGKSFDSQDRRRGDHANIYSLLDAGSRAEYNQRIVAANRERSNGGMSIGTAGPRSREGIEKRDLRERQAADRKTMYQDQTRDRAALRQAHDAQKLEHQRRGRALYAEARERAFQEIKALNADNWKAIHKITDVQARENAALSLKNQQKGAYAVASARHVELARPVKNEAWEGLKLTQDSERRQLQQRHLEEAASLSRQHIAERHALHETWQARHLDKGVQRVGARLEAHQGMVAVQSAAVTMIKMNAKAEQRNSQGGIQRHAHPRDAAQIFTERATAQKAMRATIRYELNAGRQLNETRTEAMRGVSRQNSGSDAPTSSRQRPASDHIRSRTQPDLQNEVRRVAQSSRTVSHADQANAGADAKAVISDHEKAVKERRQERFLAQISQRSDTGRTGGRSGR